MKHRPPFRDRRWLLFCKHCGGHKDNHVGVERKCLFAATTFVARDFIDYIMTNKPRGNSDRD